MTQEDKELLLKDLCARLPYGVKIHINSHIEEQNHMRLFDVNLEAETIGVRNEKWVFRAIPIIDDEDETKVIKPYLRSMSSMTDEEFAEYEKANDLDTIDSSETIRKNMEAKSRVRISKWYHGADWLNAHHFDYRGLIPMGLAVVAPEGIYKTK